MIGNIYPYFQAPNYGCFFWGWTITTDMQLALLLPIFVVAYNVREWIGNLLVTVVLAIETYCIGHVCYKYRLTAGPFSEEDWYLFAYGFQKPFLKIHTYAMGVTAAFIYMKVLDYRQLPDEAAKRAKHPVIHYLHGSSLLKMTMFAVGFGLILANLLIGHSAIAAPYSWTVTENVLYYTLTRPTYALGVHMILFVFFIDGFSLGKAFLSLPLFRTLGKLTFESALITPIMVQLIYSQLPDGLYVQFNKVLELALGNIVAVMIGGIFMYILFEYPFRRALELTLLPYCSSEKAMRLHHEYHTRLQLKESKVKKVHDVH